MLHILDQRLETVKTDNPDYRQFEDSWLTKEAKWRLFTFTPPKLLKNTVRHNINGIILGHARKPVICLGIHESRDSFIDLHCCSNTSHACLHGETTFIPGMLVGAFLIKQLTGQLPFEHPGKLFQEMISFDQITQRLYGTSTEEDRILISWLSKKEYANRCEAITPEIEAFQTTLYKNRIHPYVENFIRHIREVVGKN